MRGSAHCRQCGELIVKGWTDDGDGSVFCSEECLELYEVEYDLCVEEVARDILEESYGDA